MTEQERQAEGGERSMVAHSSGATDPCPHNRRERNMTIIFEYNQLSKSTLAKLSICSNRIRPPRQSTTGRALYRPADLDSRLGEFLVHEEV